MLYADDYKEIRLIRLLKQLIAGARGTEAQSVEGSRFKGKCRKQTQQKSISVQVSTIFEFTSGLELSHVNRIYLKASKSY